MGAPIFELASNGSVKAEIQKGRELTVLYRGNIAYPNGSHSTLQTQFAPGDDDTVLGSYVSCLEATLYESFGSHCHDN